MSDQALDTTDQRILRALREDARHNSNAAISERVEVSASTVGKRIAALETEGTIKGYRAELDYERAGFPLQVLFVCTAPIPERSELIERTLEIDTVVNVRELLTGQENVHVHAVGSSNEDITRIAHTLDELGYTVADEILMRGEASQVSL